MVQVKNFLVNYRRRFNLDEVLQEWEAEHGLVGGASGEEDDRMETEEEEPAARETKEVSGAGGREVTEGSSRSVKPQSIPLSRFLSLPGITFSSRCPEAPPLLRPFDLRPRPSPCSLWTNRTSARTCRSNAFPSFCQAMFVMSLREGACLLVMMSSVLDKKKKVYE